jgi:hypothetical protein
LKMQEATSNTVLCLLSAAAVSLIAAGTPDI